MHHLRSSTLDVQVLDPIADHDRMGTRYCSGGYIFQVTDAALGDLLTGPTYPDSFNAFDGQGIPDSFARAPIRDPATPRRAIVIGVGVCDLVDNCIMEGCVWDVQAGESSVEMTTHQAMGEYALTLHREVAVSARTVRSRIRVSNTGRVGFQVSWFPHPFFPQPIEDELCKLSADVDVVTGKGYALTQSGFVARKGWQPGKDYYLALNHDMRSNVVVLQRHPKVGLVAGCTDYTPRFFPIWGNPNTFSWEPYFENSIAAGQELSWGLDYTF